MTQRNEDDLLREEFERLRRDECRRTSVPDFEAMMSRASAEAAAEERPGRGGRDERRGDEIGQPARRPGIFARPESWLSLAAAATVAALLFASPSRADREFERLVTSYSADVASGAWSSPTDALLSTPGLDLGAVPSFGRSVRGFGSRPDDSDPENAGRDS